MLPAAVSFLEHESGRTISASSNRETIYSTDGQAGLVIHDRPFTDPSRTVTLNGTALTGDQDFWFVQDRRQPEITTMIQLRPFFFGGEAYKGDPDWFDKNLDNWYRKWQASGYPNDLKITGIIGHPVLAESTKQAWIAMTAYLFKQKDVQGSVVFSPAGVAIDIADLPPQVQDWIIHWRIRTAVAAIA